MLSRWVVDTNHRIEPRFFFIDESRGLTTEYGGGWETPHDYLYATHTGNRHHMAQCHLYTRLNALIIGVVFANPRNHRPT